MQLIRGGKLDNSRSDMPNTQNLRGQYGDTDPLQKQEKAARSEDSSELVEPSKNEGPSVDTCGKSKTL